MDSPPAQPSPDRSTGFGQCCLLLVLALIAFAPALRGGFILDWDDGLMVANNPMLVPGSGVSLAQAWQEPYAGLYAPLTYTLYAVVAAAGRAIGRPMDPAMFHAVSIALHLLGGAMVFSWLRQLTSKPGPALLGMAFWLLHPLQAEPVAWIAGTNNVLGGVLAIVALRFALLARDAAGTRRRNCLILATLAFAASLSAKPANVGLPVVLVLVHRFLLKQPWKEALTWAGLWVLVAVPFVYQGLGAQTGGLLEGELPWPQRMMIVGHALGFYFTKMICPIGLAADYGWSPTIVLAEKRWIVPAVVAAIVLVVALTQFRRRPFVFVGVGVAVAALLPILGFVPFYYQSFSIVADRYAYAALLGPAILLAWAYRDVSSRRLTSLTFGIAVLFLLATFVQVGYWRNLETLSRRAGEVNPNGLFFNYHAMNFARDAGDRDAELRSLQRIVARRPFDNIQRLRYANVLAATGRAQEAISHFRVIADREPKNPLLRVRIGQTYQAIGEKQMATRSFEAALAIAPGEPEALAGLKQLIAPPQTQPVATQPAGR